MSCYNYPEHSEADMHHLSLLLSQLPLLPGGKATAPPKKQTTQLNKEKLFCGFSSSND